MVTSEGLKELENLRADSKTVSSKCHDCDMLLPGCGTSVPVLFCRSVL